MNLFLKELFDKTAIDTKYLESYLSPNEQQYLDSNLQSIEDLDDNLYTDNEGEDLESRGSSTVFSLPQG